MEVTSVEAIVRALNEAQVRYLIVGGLAVNARGYERDQCTPTPMIAECRELSHMIWGLIPSLD